MFIEMAKRKIDAFRNLDAFLAKIKDAVKNADPKAEVYLFGSVASGHHNMASDIDVLIVSDVKRDLIQVELNSNLLGFPFEFHIRSRKEAELYFRHIAYFRKI